MARYFIHPLVRSLALSTCWLAAIGHSAEPDETRLRALGQEYQLQIVPLLKEFCHECHSGEVTEAEIDFARFASFSEARRQTRLWQKTRAMLLSEQMPPEDARQPSQPQRERLLLWVNAYLKVQAEARAGDPGRVVLRRLSNAEYNYTIRDLTGLKDLDPTEQFPVDGASGEGFTNVGDALVMSPSLVRKYMDAAKEVADHMVLLPDGIEFSPYSTRRDWTDQWLTRIQSIYRESTDDAGGTKVNLQGIQFDTNQGGRLPVLLYLAATLGDRQRLKQGAVQEVAQRRGLKAKYLRILWQAFSGEDSQQRNHLLGSLARRWQSSTEADAPALAAEIARWQDALWKFNAVGQIGRANAPQSWMEPVTPVVAGHQLRLSLPKETDREDFVFYLAVGDAGDGDEGDLVVCKNFRLEGKDMPPWLIRDAAGIERRIDEVRKEMLSQTSRYLAAAVAAQDGKLAEAAAKHDVDPDLLKVWLNYLMFRGPAVAVEGLYTERIGSNYEFVKGWGSHATPSVVANASDQEVRIPGISKPHSVTTHPSPTLFTAAAWRSPISGEIQVESQIADAHADCGNGIEWFLQLRTASGAGNLWQGEYERGGKATMPAKTVFVRAGELVSLIIGPRNSEHTCDLTQIDLQITEVGGAARVWNLAQDVSGDIQAGNPHADRFGNADVWCFYQGEVASLDRTAVAGSMIPPGSILDRWKSEKDPARRNALAEKVQALAIGDPPAEAASVDADLYRQLWALQIPAGHPRLSGNIEADPRFGKHPLGGPVEPTDLIVKVPAVVELRVGKELAAGRDVVVDVDPTHGGQGSVQVQLLATRPKSLEVSPAVPILVAPGSEARRRATRALAELGNLFPPALCYARIVPVDEVVTLLLFYREDDHLQRLMLSDAECERLDRLWDELLYISAEPLQLVVSHEQLYEFATQDRPDLLKEFEPLREPLRKRADAFRRRLIETQPAHVAAVLDLVDRAWRRPLGARERSKLQSLYSALRDSELPHDEAIRLVLARALASPTFLYRREVAGEGTAPHPVSDWELASRLSYFLWSSLPDQQLRREAASGRLHDDRVLLRETERMLKHPAVRRLAEQFACQWLHVRDFDQNQEKNEKLYPEFSGLRGAMYQETVRFFEDMFAGNGSVLGIIDADHTFLNESLARHYGIAGVTGDQWRRVDGVRDQGRGGVIAMATVLASQSGASRTSPILRGNWIYETLLGQRLPRPPAGVPQLPDEAPQGLTARQLIEKHSRDPSCAKCHVKIDPYGFSLEQYDAIGRLRTETVDTKTRLADDRQIEGLAGLRDYLLQSRRDDVLRQFCRKLLGYALGREIQLSDEPLLDKMQQELADNEYRFHTAVAVVVTSKQFREIRGRDFVEP